MMPVLSPEAPVDSDALLAFAKAIYARAGLSEEDAHVSADSLVQADLWGHQTHGVMRLPWYVKRLQTGAVKANTVPVVALDSGAVVVVDGQEAMGQVSARRAAELAIERAGQHGICAVAVRNSNHFGTAMYFTLMAARAGCVGFLSTNASPAMPPWGGRSKAVGTNPWSWAAPAGANPPMVLDIANTGVARGKIYLARQKGLEIPLGWALDAEGRETTDPVAALGGVTLPMAGHKGYAISVMMDMLSGVLSGSAFGASVNGPYQAEKPGGVGHLMIAMKIDAFQPRAQFESRMERLIAELRATPLAVGYDEIVYPGELEARNDARHRREGLLLPADTISDLAALATEWGCMDLLPLVR
ncbi:LDH2 family malate/lactate/ureidoglycolate dehydrogenase [Sphingobium sp. B1D7B]|uniref:Ldh family oxidoreductase n=1 Tax=Sphingobium sp. B1D7B TaxID=2940578 RepID=UPI0022244511|nr:Ldh family oxidoreductase [Sphingobium sp. B1D7B]MCW2406869.1 LDH2 family malate/lactate/ureidoglycolate dehydrogenase [Sphingobium sp. B1D7B]